MVKNIMVQVLPSSVGKSSLRAVVSTINKMLTSADA